ncbi:MAG: hypothetical protein JSW00_17190 [Thermoplasmata archaeon]|nr:MAG: hypothetical protein JSW00_17190 [Thermoplasmata archaeon]
MGWEDIMGDWRFWTTSISIIMAIVILKSIGIKMYKPKFKIMYETGRLDFIKTKDGDITDCKLFFALNHTNGFKEIPIPTFIKRNFIKKDSVTYAFPENFPYRRIDSPIIWKLGYYNHPFWLYSCECFDWDGHKWVSRNWNELYAIGNWAWLFLMGKLRKKGYKQIKRWKKEIKKEEKEEKYRTVT